MVAEEWEIEKIGNLFEFKNGLNKGKEFFGYGTPIINYTDVYNHRGLTKKEVNGKVSLENNELNRYAVKKGDVFFTRTSETPEEVGISSVLLEDIPDCAFSGFILRGRPKTDRLLPEYCQYCFSAPKVRNEIISRCTYTTRALTNGKQLSAINIPVPEKTEQIAIATALSDIDSLINSLCQLIAKKKNIRQGTMQALLTGKRRLPGFVEEWRETLLDDVADRFDNLRVPISADKRVKGYTPYYGANGIQDYVDGYTHNGEYVLIAEDGANDLQHYPIRYVRGKIWANNHVHVLQGKHNVIYTKFLSYVMTCVNFESILVGGTRAKLNAKSLMRIKIYIPINFKEQQAISEIIYDMESEISALQTQLQKYENIKKGMMEKLLTGQIRLV